MSQSIRGIIWDLSGVLTEEDPVDINAFAGRCELPIDIWRKLFERYFEEERNWDKVERGELTLDLFGAGLVTLIEAYGGTCTIQMAQTIWGDPDPFHNARRVRSELFPIIQELRKSFVTCLCTNNTREWRPIWSKMIPLVPLFDWLFDSSEIGYRKPEPSFWKHVEYKLQLESNQLLLIDDRLENLIGAKNHGWHVLQFVNVESCIQALKNLVGPLPQL